MATDHDIKEKYNPYEFANACYDLGGGLNEGFFGGLRAKNLDNSIPELKESLEEFERVFLQYEEIYFDYQRLVDAITELFEVYGIELSD